MHGKIIGSALIVIAAAGMAACGTDTAKSASGNGSSALTSTVVVHPSAQTIPSTATGVNGGQGTVDQTPVATTPGPTSTFVVAGGGGGPTAVAPVPSTAGTSNPNAGHGTGISAFAGTWYRHDSVMTLSNADLTGTMLIGQSAFDLEKWLVRWERNGPNSIQITLTQRLILDGQGSGQTMQPGDTYNAELGNNTLQTVDNRSGLASTWCGNGANDPACGA